MSKFGLVGKNIDYSFSKTYFTNKFKKENLQHTYQNFDINTIKDFQNILRQNTDIKGLNVTIPYKESVIPLLSKIDKEAQSIGAVNTIKISKDNELIGYNTDHYGFAKALSEFPPIKQKTALVLGNGGAAKAIIYVLKHMKFSYKIVSRTASENTITYQQLNKKIIQNHFLIINTTPLGTSPNISESPAIPYNFLTNAHLLFDLIYNPPQTTFLKKGAHYGATTTNGLKMLHYQAEKAWSIWNS